MFTHPVLRLRALVPWLIAAFVVLASAASTPRPAAEAAGGGLPEPITQVLRALARLVRGKAEGEAPRAASRRPARAVCGGRRLSEIRVLRPESPGSRVS